MNLCKTCLCTVEKKKGLSISQRSSCWRDARSQGTQVYNFEVIACPMRLLVTANLAQADVFGCRILEVALGHLWELAQTNIPFALIHRLRLQRWSHLSFAYTRAMYETCNAVVLSITSPAVFHCNASSPSCGNLILFQYFSLRHSALVIFLICAAWDKLAHAPMGACR